MSGSMLLPVTPPPSTLTDLAVKNCEVSADGRKEFILGAQPCLAIAFRAAGSRRNSR